MEENNPDRWRQVDEAFHVALHLAETERRAYVEKTFVDDAALRADITSLLEADKFAGDFLQEPVFELGLEVLMEDLTQSTLIKPALRVTDKAESLIGITLAGRYEIISKLGDGGMGNVYKGFDTKLFKRPVVVKVLKEKSLQNDWIVTKFKQEAEAITKIDDPGVVGVFDADNLPDGEPYIVMQFVEGTNLREQLTEGGMEFNTVADIIMQVCRTLANAHEQGVIHRDLKPENIMVRQNASGDLIVKVIDFGIAKVKNSVIAPSTQTGLVAGTERYMSPEHLLGKKVDHTSDIYALGIIAYEMLTGRIPFNPETRYQLHELQREGVKAMPADLRPGLSKAAQNVLLRALSYEPSDRYQSTRTFAHELAQALINETESEENSSQMQNDRIKVAHVLFLDIVGYSRLPTDHQSTILSQLQEIVRGTAEFSRAKDKKELVLIPTGDGMALVFFGNPDAPVHCALEISKALKSHPEIQLRMGIHSGPVNQILDVNGNINVAGAGINMAQRVMDCGDAGHILLSKRIADDLGQYSSWQQHLHDLGETEVKHGVRMYIVNLYKDDLGNPELPEKFKRRKNPSFLLSAMAVVLALVIIGGVLIIWAPWSRKVADSKSSAAAPIPARIITYSLTMQKGSRDPKTNKFTPLGDPFESTGQEIFGNDWEFQVNITPSQSGSIYLINEGPGVGGATVYNVLFPTKVNNNYVAQTAANQTRRAKAYFDEHPGTEKLWIIWSTYPLDKLDKIFKDSGESNTTENVLVISDPAHIKTVRDLLATYDSAKPEVVTNKTKRQTTIKGSGDVLISLLELQHEKY